jgi:hypothetical protein
VQARAGRLAREKSLQRGLFKDFIMAASKVSDEALIVPLALLTGRMPADKKLGGNGNPALPFGATFLPEQISICVEYLGPSPLPASRSSDWATRSL